MIDGKLWALPWQAALELGRNLISESKKAEEVAVANRVIADSALMIRAGVPFALSRNRKIIEDAKTMAQWDTGLRRAVRANFPRAVFGTPSIGNEVK